MFMVKKGIKKIVSLALIALVGSVAFVGCSGTSPSSVVRSNFKVLAKGTESSVASDFLGNINKDIAKANAEKKKSAENLGTEVTEAVNKQLKKLECKILGENIDGDKATVRVKVKGANIMKSFKSYMDRMVEEANTMALTGKQLNEEEAKNFSKKIMVEEINKATSDEREKILNLVKNNEGWEIQKDVNALEAVFGELSKEE